MKKFCENCGSELPENANVCPNCGTFVEIKEPAKVFENISKTKMPGNGMSTAGMVIGIIAAVWSFFEILSIGSINPAVKEMLNSYETLVTPRFILFWFSFGYTILSLIPSLIGLPLSIAGLLKQKSGKNISGIILNVVSLATSIFIFIYIMTMA